MEIIRLRKAALAQSAREKIYSIKRSHLFSADGSRNFEFDFKSKGVVKGMN